ncbi:hypothetical protein ETAA8_16180 [Anatilimnocola aggregata]|uniref:Feruloyl esterase n=1 Tax=Anatilimnocola aggregata TaxID=2528021 RepID=A0A517Y8G0_9BACT|nr:hypothetical protein [Anatilimnocola aggregata]QDU26538.1 hypothetical protein ETAA8_16180 [Anatilimnocola aggregata]
MTRILLAILFTASAAVVGAEQTPNEDLTARVEYTLKTARTRDPVLGGPRDKVSVSVWIPDGVKTLRGGICNPFSKGDDVGKHWQAACRHWQFAYVQVDFDAVKKEEFTLLATGLTDLAKKSGHPELEHLPMCFTGMSRGGGMSMQLAELMPERTIAVAPVCLEVGPGSDATRRVPVMTVFGEKDGSQMEKLLTKLPAERKLEARYGIAVQWNRKHEFALANNLSFVFFDDVITRRLPKQTVADKPTPLADIPLADGSLGDLGTWGKDGKVPTIAAWKDFKGDPAAACWFPSQRSATVWQSFVGASKDVTIIEPPGLGDKQPFFFQSAKKPVKVKLTLGDGVNPAKVVLWDADQRLAEKTEGPWTFQVSLKPGIHALNATVEGGVRRTSRPHTIVVDE